MEDNYPKFMLKGKNLIILGNLITFFLFACVKISQAKYIFLNEAISEIRLIIGAGNRSILNDSFYLEPSKVIVNGIIKNECKKFCQMEKEENNVSLFFNSTVESCQYMFYNSYNIKEIDFSNFDFSEVTLMTLLIVIFNNGVLGMVRQWQTMFYGKRYSSTTLGRKTDFPALARAFGAEGKKVASLAYLEDALANLAPDVPTVLDCHIYRNEFVLPMIPPGGCVKDLITEKACNHE